MKVNLYYQILMKKFLFVFDTEQILSFVMLYYLKSKTLFHLRIFPIMSIFDYLLKNALNQEFLP
ncbi:MAG: hypothetical protein D3913_11795 [Candidatus Electrothrix sp. LOE1_4_5]|nr:hypothetical protein [Candidatus Electrothrix gigas]